MKKLVVFSLIFAGVLSDAFAAPRPTGGRNSRAGTENTSVSSQSKTTAARAATGARSATRATGATSANATKVVNRGRAATTTAGPVVSARAGVTQKVIGTGTKVAAAAKNIVVSEECQQKYEGCMDAFCMLDNETGGRCLCSDRNAELDIVLEEIEKLDQQSYQMATFGVEKIEMGNDAESAIANANAVAQSVLNESERKSSRRSLDLSMWDMSVDFDVDSDIFGSSASSPVDGKEGDALYRAASQICVEQIPECSGDMNMLQLMYAQRIKSDCAAYENSLKQQKNASQQKLSAAEQALREAALEQLRTANKYDLGQCTIEFKKCMQTTGGCGNDFAGCASVAAMDNTNVVKSTSKKAKNYQIKGAVTNIEISASTYDTLLAKKPLCETITKSCVAVADQVWETFLRDVAPQVKNAELIAEDNARQNCIGNISSCFQKACKENMDPNDPDGSYDLCLSRPGTMLNLCKVPLNACGIDSTSESAAEQSDIWDYVLARLASMRVDSCTREVKECLQSEDRCGEDYVQCVGLDTDTIIRMCPYDKLVGCQKVYGESEIRGDAVYEELATMVQGIMLNIDNSFMVQCQNAVNEAMIRVCGDTENCDNLTVDANIGARSLEYKICEYVNGTSTSNCKVNVEQIPDSDLGQGNTNAKSFIGRFEGEIPWDLVSFIDESGALKTSGFVEPSDENVVLTENAQNEINVLQKNVATAIATIEADPTVQYCMTGRRVQGMSIMSDDEEGMVRKDLGEQSEANARFPELTGQMRGIIATSALKIAKNNYYKKYDELNAELAKDYVAIAERMAQVKKEDSLDARREMARRACVNLAQGAVLATSLGKNNMQTSGASTELIGSKQRNDWNYKETVTATFEWETLNCRKCVRTQNCTKPKRKWCKAWGEEEETCTDIQF